MEARTHGSVSRPAPASACAAARSEDTGARRWLPLTVPAPSIAPTSTWTCGSSGQGLLVALMSSTEAASVFIVLINLFSKSLSIKMVPANSAESERLLLMLKFSRVSAPVCLIYEITIQGTLQISLIALSLLQFCNLESRRSDI